MKGILGKALSPSFAISALALAIALGGGAAWAAAGPATPRLTVSCVNVTNFQNGWKNFGKAQGYHVAEICKDSLGYVHLDGSIKGGTANSRLFVLPKAYRPDFNHAFAVAAGVEAPAAEDIYVFNNGVVAINGTTTDSLSLDGVIFRAD